MRTAQLIEERRPVESTAPTRKRGQDKKPRRVSAKSLANLRPQPPWPKGVSGNPSGKPGTDLAALYARQFFEAHPEGVSEEMAAKLKGFNAYAYGVLADRGYGKVKDKVEHTGADGAPLSITVKLVKPDGDSNAS